MSVYKSKGSPFYRYDFQREGTRYFGSSRRTTEAEAKVVERAKKAAVAAELEKQEARALLGLDAPAAPSAAMPLGQACGRYWLEVAQHGASAATTQPQLVNLARIIGSAKPLDAVTNDDMTKFISRRRGEKTKTSPKKGPPRYMSPSSVNREVEVLRAVMNRARKLWGVTIAKAPDWADLMLDEPDAPDSILSDATEEAIRQNLRRDLHNFFEFSLLAGMRKMGQVRLKKTQVNFEARVIRLKVKSRKPGGRNVSVRLTRRMIAILKAEWGNHPEFVFTYVAHRRSKDRVVGQHYPLTESGWRRLWKDATKAAGVPNHRWHDNRHTGATRLGRSSHDLSVVQKYLGHADIASTMRYKHTTEDDVLNAMEELHARKSPVRSPVRTTAKRVKS